MINKLLNKCDRTTGVMRSFHCTNIGHYLRLMAGRGTKAAEGGEGFGGASYTYM